MSVYKSEEYLNQVKKLSELDYAWDKLKDKSVAISGATGMIGSMIVDALLFRNEKFSSGITIYALTRSLSKAAARFSLDEAGLSEKTKESLKLIEADITSELPLDIKPDFIIHAASSTHPLQYSEDPIGTIAANVIGTDKLLSWASEAGARFVFLSSVEIYGECSIQTPMKEDYLGYIDCNTLRAGYPESKRTGEALCQAYKKQKGLDVVSVRLSRVYGPTLLKTDTKALSQFIGKALNGENIVLKSEGTQFYSYCYSYDAVSAIIYLMLNGENGEAYNVASKDSDIALRDLAAELADIAGTKVVFELPDAKEAAGYSKATRAVLDTEKVRNLGWSSDYDIKEGLRSTINILKSL